ncbi:hypothetical protein [Janthinobacterium sp.]|uniref:hypothetical protein n=1 Tax=Janthinobacterium sp. TaxID=1871054 RepID=UPI00258FC119|nr:hypothetical protein [Janthinobacterium sp.]MCX7289574.1 hypothetical protein [Janthinobacterium sp.]
MRNQENEKLGTSPTGAAESRGQALVPDWMGVWATAGPLLAQFEIRLTPASTCIDADGFLAWYRFYPNRDAAALAAIMKAAIHRLEHSR